MLSHHDNRNSREGKRIITVLATLVAVGATLLLLPPARSVLTQGVYVVAQQVWATKMIVGDRIGSVSASFQNNGALYLENLALHEEINRMQSQMLDRNLLAERVATLEAALGRAQGDNRVVASVLSGGSSAPYDILILDAGSNNGIAKSDIVVLAGSGAIGEIVEVTNTSSKARLYSTSGVEVPAVVGIHATPVLAIGRGMGNFDAKVPENSLVSVGDNVVSSKGNLILGAVSFVEEKPAEPFKRIYFRQPFNITEIRSVEVVLTNDF